MRLMAIWLGRVLSNALAGGVAFGFVGAFCGGGAGLALGLIVGFGDFGAIFGATIGAATGLVGTLIHAIVAASAPPGEMLEPFFGITAKLAFGQGWGTIGICTAFLAFELAKSQLNNVGFTRNVDEDIVAMMVVAPATMIMVAIAAAIFKRD